MRVSFSPRLRRRTPNPPPVARAQFNDDAPRDPQKRIELSRRLAQSNESPATRTPNFGRFVGIGCLSDPIRPELLLSGYRISLLKFPGHCVIAPE